MLKKKTNKIYGKLVKTTQVTYLKLVFETNNNRIVANAN